MEFVLYSLAGVLVLLGSSLLIVGFILGIGSLMEMLFNNEDENGLL